jgi:hypothetical protein
VLASDYPLAAARIAAARPWQSYIVTVDPLVLNVTLRHVLATTFMAVWLPVRVSPGNPPPWVWSTITQRRRPAATSCAIQVAVTELSRPEKPPRPATSALELRIAAAALL